ncbi:ATP-binding protein [Leptospira sarikeiensis]|uniref:ATP-binding protein n=1 Tax=Leptospira sarikeiensis TaxID=2484943 RepID=A0A4R9K0S1_9LEPT|nr:ATP-binding protein [Leptospira sarikeiensis]TGL58711.1 ATP-binding protein [Leptospira sarikeiensis]
MAKHEVELIANEGIFKGLAKQNMLFHQCICELIDNSISAKSDTRKFIIDVILHKIDDLYISVFVCDNGSGMNLETMKNALQLGKEPVGTNRLNEHGFGLKNALATLSSASEGWSIFSKDLNSGKIASVNGPFGPKMKIEDDDNFPNFDFLPADCTTIIECKVKLSFVQTLQGRGAPTSDLSKLREWLIEHLGVLYRGYIENDPISYDNLGNIYISIDKDRQVVPPIPVPLGARKTEYFDVEISGKNYKLEYQHGTIDEVKRDKLVRGNKSKYYYLGNTSSQGIDIRLGKRVIAVRQLETIWKTDEGNRSTQVTRHSDFNDFAGELIIPELPRGVLSTVNNKTDFNLDDNDWQKIFDQLNNFKPPRRQREKSESELRKRWVAMLKATNPLETISDEKTVWPTGVRIDVYRKMANSDIIIYELKVGTGAPQHLYQLKMYWDGLALQNEEPKEGILLVEDFNTTLEEMANKINGFKSPTGKQYNLKVEKLKDRNLLS